MLKKKDYYERITFYLQSKKKKIKSPSLISPQFFNWKK